MTGGRHWISGTSTPDDGPNQEQVHCDENTAADPQSPVELAVVSECSGRDRERKPDWLKNEKKAPGEGDQQESGGKQQTSV